MKRKYRIVRSRPVLVFYVSRNSRSPLLRVLWKVSRKDAKRLCSDERTSGANHMLCWTADGTEGEDWAFVVDKGNYDAVLEELETTILDCLEKKRAEGRS